MTECAVVRHMDNPITAASLIRLWSDFPKALELPNGKRIVSPVGPEHFGKELDQYRFVEVVRVDWNAPGQYYTKASETYSLGLVAITLTRTWTAWTQAEIDAFKAAQKQAQIADYLTSGVAAIDFALAKQVNPTLTKGQFATFAANNWSEPA